MDSEPQPSIGETVASITDQVKGLVQGEIALAKAQTREKYAPYGPAAGLFAGAALFGLIGLCWLIYTGYLALTEVLAPWAAGLITTGAVLLITAVLALAGAALIRKAKRAQITVGESIKADVAAVKEGFRR